MQTIIPTTTATTALAPRITTFSSYSPSYPKESTAAAGSGGISGRGPRKQVNHKGLFAKECEFVTFWELRVFQTLCCNFSEEFDVWLRR
jgi:hypothetical protein